MNFLNKHEILTPCQFGFRKNYSTYMAAVNFCDQISQGIDNNLSSVGIFIDLSKAFDPINHRILLQKLYAYGVRGCAHAWFTSYLSNRPHYVTRNGEDSSLLLSNMGVPQGSILGPLLFLIYINDICNSSLDAQFYLFAIDTTVLFQNKKLTTVLEKAQQVFSHMLNG